MGGIEAGDLGQHTDYDLYPLCSGMYSSLFEKKSKVADDHATLRLTVNSSAKDYIFLDATECYGVISSDILFFSQLKNIYLLLSDMQKRCHFQFLPML
jgi:hypothetical protein